MKLKYIKKNLIVFFILLFSVVFPSISFAIHPDIHGLVYTETGQPLPNQVIMITQRVEETYVPPVASLTEQELRNYINSSEAYQTTGYRFTLTGATGEFGYASTGDYDIRNDPDFPMHIEASTLIDNIDGKDYYGYMANCQSGILHQRGTNPYPYIHIDPQSPDKENNPTPMLQSVDCRARAIITPNPTQIEALGFSYSEPIPVSQDWFWMRPANDTTYPEPNCSTCNLADNFACGAVFTNISVVSDEYECSSLEYKNTRYTTRDDPAYDWETTYLRIYSNGIGKYGEPSWDGFNGNTYFHGSQALTQNNNAPKNGLNACLAQAANDEEKKKCFLEIEGYYFTNSVDKLQVPPIYCRPKKQNEIVEFEKKPTEQNLSNLVSTNSRISCLGVSSCSADANTCTTASFFDPNQQFFTQIDGLATKRTNELKLDPQDEMWLLACIGIPNPLYTQDGANGPFKYNVCTTGSVEGDRAMVDKGLLNLYNPGDGTTMYEFLTNGRGMEIETWKVKPDGTRNPEPLSQPLIDIQDNDPNTPDDNATPEKVEFKIIPKNREDITDYFFVVAHDMKFGAGNVADSDGGPKQATLSNLGAASCSYVIDPRGTVFDSYTLEPLKNVDVTLLTNDEKSGEFLPLSEEEPFITANPLSTLKDGAFSFLVPDGEYKLNPEKEGYTFPNQPSNLNPNAGALYSELYRGETIVQKGEIEHRDIPMDPIDLKKSVEFAKNNPIEIMHTSEYVDRENNEHVVQGRLSHSKGSVTAYGKTPTETGAYTETRIIGETTADQDGIFKLHINLSQLEEGEIVGDIVAEKAEIIPQKRESNPLVAVVQSVKTSLSLDMQKEEIRTDRMPLTPILDSVEGYAYDSEGKIMPNAQVDVKTYLLAGSQHTTNADENGYFSIPEGVLPNLPYRISFTSPSGESLATDTSFFVAKNATVIEKSGTTEFAYVNTPQADTEDNSGESEENNDNKAVLGVGSHNPPQKNNLEALAVMGMFIAGVLIFIKLGVMRAYSFRNSAV